MFNVFIDGSAGTTGLKIVDRLSKRSDINLIKLPDTYALESSSRAISALEILFASL